MTLNIGSPFSTPPLTEIGSDEPSEDSVIGPSPPKHSFFLKMKPANHLKTALEALADPEVNEHRLGTIHVDETGFEIMVRNACDAIARLWIERKPGMDMVFHFFKPFTQMSFQLPPIPLRFPDDDEVSIFHEIESDKLWFQFATSKLWVPFKRLEVLLDSFPPVSCFCAAVIPTGRLGEMIDLVMHAQGPTAGTDRLVSVDIKENYASFEVGTNKKWEFDYKKLGLVGAKGATGGQIHRAWFNWTYYDFLKIGSRLLMFSLHFVKKPNMFVMFKFETKPVELMIIKKAIMMLGNVDQATVTYEQAKEKAAEKRASSSGAKEQEKLPTL